MEELSSKDQINDYLLTTLRTSAGADFLKLRDQMDYDLLSIRGNYINDLIANGFAELHDFHLRLTRKGRFLADKISSDLFLSS